MQRPLLHRQPWRLLYLLYFGTQLLIVKLPLWTILSIFPSQRPRASWSITKCISTYILRSVIEFPIKLGLEFKRDLTIEISDHKLKKAKFVWVPPISEENIADEIKEYARKNGVNAVRIPGYWQFRENVVGKTLQQAQVDEKVFYHIHGGGFTLGSAHPADASQRIPREIMVRSKSVARTFSLDYRLSSAAPFLAENPFPAGLLDSLAGYKYLLGMGFQPKNIILAGDSAGGNLCLALLRYLKANQKPDEGIPRRLILLSPWGDISTSRIGPTSSLTRNASSDIFPTKAATNHKKGFGGYGAIAYIGKLDWEEAKTNPYMSPASPHLKETAGLFTDYPKTYILVGGAERILDDSLVLAERMGADNPTDGWITLDVAEDATHDFIMFPWNEPERTKALTRLSKWIDE